MVGDEFGTFSMYTEFEDDPRDWLVEDYLMEDAFWPEKIGCIFLTLIRVVRLYQK